MALLRPPVGMCLPILEDEQFGAHRYRANAGREDPSVMPCNHECDDRNKLQHIATNAVWWQQFSVRHKVAAG
jgi:hypothetical protein